VVTYDRSDLIHLAVHTLWHELLQEMLIVSGVIVLFLFHFRSALIPILTLPIAVVLAFIPMARMGLTANIMSLGGIAVAIGAMVDASIIMVENVHKKLEAWEAGGRQGSRDGAIVHALKEVGRPIFFALLVIAVSFLPIFTLEATEGGLFKPLAVTKTFSMGFSVLQQMDRRLRKVPAVETVFGKIGRAKTATDPAPLSMVETVVSLKPESQWRKGMTWERLIADMDRRMRFPGMPNIWWMPIQTR